MSYTVDITDAGLLENNGSMRRILFNTIKLRAALEEVYAQRPLGITATFTWSRWYASENHVSVLAARWNLDALAANIEALGEALSTGCLEAPDVPNVRIGLMNKNPVQLDRDVRILRDAILALRVARDGCTLDGAKPTAVASIPATATSGAAFHEFTVTFSDNVAVDVSTIAGADITVTGPGGFLQACTLQSLNVGTNGTPRVGTFQCAARGGTWGYEDNGTYTVTLAANSVADTSGTLIDETVLGTFVVEVPMPADYTPGLDPITPPIDSDDSVGFREGQNLPAASYRVRYVSGAMKYAGTGDPLRIDLYGLSFPYGFKIVHSGGTEINAPGGSDGYSTTAEVETAYATAGNYVDFAHSGGTITMYLFDDPYTDNLPGTTTPTFTLEKLT